MKTKLKTESFYDTRKANAEKLVLHCGVPACLGGFDALTDCIILASEYPDYGICNIYSAVGALRKIKPRSVLRNVTYAIYKAVNIADSLSRIVGTHISAQEIHAGLVITYLSRIVKNPTLSPLYDPKTGTFRLELSKRRTACARENEEIQM